MELHPSEIRYSQDSIRYSFRGGKRIGETLDNICEQRTKIEEIPAMLVTRIDDRWVTWDNRRLWVFRHLERLGKCDKVPVIEVSYTYTSKMTSSNEGVSVVVRGFPCGTWFQKFPDGRDGYTEQAEKTNAISDTTTKNSEENRSDEDKDATNIVMHFRGLNLDSNNLI